MWRCPRNWPIHISFAAVAGLGCGHNDVSGAEGSPDQTSGAASETGETENSDTSDTSDTDELEPLAALPHASAVNTGRVATAMNCENCHSNSEGAVAMRDSADRGIGPYDLWRSSMMANSSRDPFWHAMVEAEVFATPAAKSAIEAKCTRCHTPLLAAELELTGAPPPTMSMLFEEDSERAALAVDGVSCSLCHQIEDQNLAQAESFSGHWVVKGEGRIYGPHADPFTMPMVHHVDMAPVEGHQIEQSAVCGTCHTLHTNALEPDGSPTGHTLAEQAPYLEWRNSAYSTEATAPGPQAASCQSCHAPRSSVDGVAISTRIARRPMGDDFPPIAEREPYGRHTFVGGNALMLSVLRDQAEVLRPNAPAEAFDATIAATREQLATSTAQLSIGDAKREGEQLGVAVRIDNLAGHKLPTGFPSRRSFLRVEVRDAQGQVVFRSGDFDGRGRLLDGEGEILASEFAGGPTEPHRDLVSASSEVQVWEAIMADTEGHPAYRLLRGASYLKDNRLLPVGWSDLLVTPDIAPVGVGSDPDFESAGDTVTYRFSAPASAGPYTFEASLHYQVISPRFAAELFALDGPRIRAFETMLNAANTAPELIDEVLVVLE